MFIYDSIINRHACRKRLNRFCIDMDSHEIHIFVILYVAIIWTHGQGIGCNSFDWMLYFYWIQFMLLEIYLIIGIIHFIVYLCISLISLDAVSCSRDIYLIIGCNSISWIFCWLFSRISWIFIRLFSRISWIFIFNKLESYLHICKFIKHCNYNLTLIQYCIVFRVCKNTNIFVIIFLASQVAEIQEQTEIIALFLGNYWYFLSFT